MKFLTGVTTMLNRSEKRLIIHDLLYLKNLKSRLPYGSKEKIDTLNEEISFIENIIQLNNMTQKEIQGYISFLQSNQNREYYYE